MRDNGLSHALDNPDDPWYIIEIKRFGDKVMWLKWDEHSNLNLAEKKFKFLQEHKSPVRLGELFIFKRSYVTKEAFGYGEWDEC